MFEATIALAMLMRRYKFTLAVTPKEVSRGVAEVP
jgi:hypothetical protein